LSTRNAITRARKSSSKGLRPVLGMEQHAGKATARADVDDPRRVGEVRHHRQAVEHVQREDPSATRLT
jgi:hypothetical protein